VIALWRSVVPLALVLIILVVLFYAVLPTRTYMDQRSAADGARAELAALVDENNALRFRLAALSQPEEVERLQSLPLLIDREQMSLLPDEDK